MQALASVGELEIHQRRTYDDIAQAELSLTLASGAVRAYCGWDLAREDTTFQVDGDGSQVLSLPTLYLESVTAIRINGLTIAETDRSYPIWSRKGQLLRAAGWPVGCVVEVDAVHGYDPIPDLVKLCVLDLAVRHDVNPQNLVAATVGQVTRNYAYSSDSGSNPTALSPLHTNLLARFSL